MADTRPQYRVTGACVTLKTATPAGPRMIGFQFGAIVPADVPQDQIDHHLRVKLIAPIDASAEPAAKSARPHQGGRVPRSPTWAPTLADVARHVPTRTRDTTTPGSDALLGSFTEGTTPTAEQAQAYIDQAVQWVVSECGQLPIDLPRRTS